MDSFASYSGKKNGDTGVHNILALIVRRLDHQDECVDKVKEKVNKIMGGLILLGVLVPVLTGIIEAWVHHH